MKLLALRGIGFWVRACGTGARALQPNGKHTHMHMKGEKIVNMIIKKNTSKGQQAGPLGGKLFLPITTSPACFLLPSLLQYSGRSHIEFLGNPNSRKLGESAPFDTQLWFAKIDGPL